MKAESVAPTCWLAALVCAALAGCIAVSGCSIHNIPDSMGSNVYTGELHDVDGNIVLPPDYQP